jgi:hypothetical protein
VDDPLSAMVAFWMFFILCTQQVLAPAPAKDGFTQELATKVGTQLAGSISDRYFAESPQHELVVLEDVHGWVPLLQAMNKALCPCEKAWCTRTQQ